jgi:hypothetical protein
VTREEVNLAALDRRAVGLYSLARHGARDGGGGHVWEDAPTLPLGLMLVSYDADDAESTLRKNRGRTTRRQRGCCTYFDGAIFGARVIDVVRALGATGGALNARRGMVEREMVELSSTWSSYRGGAEGAGGAEWSGWPERMALAGGRLIRPQAVLTARATVADRPLGSPRAVLGATAALVVLFDAVAELSHFRPWLRRPSIAKAGQVAINELGDWIGRAPERHRDSFVAAAVRERVRLTRAVEAASHPEMVSRLDRLSVANALRAEVAAFRHAAWPPADALSQSAMHSSAAYTAEAVCVGVRAGLLHAESPAVPLAAVHGLSPWQARPSMSRPCATASSSGTSASGGTAASQSARSDWSGTSSSGALTSVCEGPPHGDLHAMTALFAFGGAVSGGWAVGGAPGDASAIGPQKRPREWVGLTTL